jgi:hypothetical protein
MMAYFRQNSSTSETEVLLRFGNFG